MTVQIFEGRNGTYSVLTDCGTEGTFLGQLTSALAKIILEDGWRANNLDGTQKAQQLEAQSLFDLQRLLVEVVEPAVEICIKYRGYKSEVKERRELFFGEDFPALGAPCKASAGVQLSLPSVRHVGGQHAQPRQPRIEERWAQMSREERLDYDPDCDPELPTYQHSVSGQVSAEVSKNEKR